MAKLDIEEPHQKNGGFRNKPYSLPAARSGERARQSSSFIAMALITALCISGVIAMTVVLVFQLKSQQTVPVSDKCFQMCEPDNVWDGVRERIMYKKWSNGAERSYTLFPFPQKEPEFSGQEVGEELKLTPLILRGRLEEAKARSEVKGLEIDTVSYSGFLTIKNKWESNMFFWFFPSQVNPGSAPLIVWLQGGPGSTSLFGLLKENGPFLVKVKKLPDKDPYIKPNKYSWNKFANMLYIDSPAGTGFTYASNDQNYHTNDSLVSIDLMSFLFQFMRMYPLYVSADPSFKPNVYLFGESYGGTVVTNLAHLLMQMPNFKSKINLKGIGIGNGFISPINQCTTYSSFLAGLGMINHANQELLEETEHLLKYTLSSDNSTDTEEDFPVETLGKNKLRTAYILWQRQLKQIQDILGISSMNDLTKEVPDITKRNFWHYLQQSHVRRAIHVGNRLFSDGEMVRAFVSFFREKHSGKHIVFFCRENIVLLMPFYSRGRGQKVI